MNISFDLDSTLIPNGKEFETEKRNWVAKLFGFEPIRKGTRTLIQDLQTQGHQIHIYTTSYRTQRRIRWTLRCYGIQVNRIVNQKENSIRLKELNVYASKYPRGFDFDVHIDDSKGVGMEGEKYNFKTIIVDPKQENWESYIKQEIQRIEQE